MDVNKVTLLGNLARDPGVKRLPSGQNLTFFRLATNYAWKDIKTKEKKEAVDFHPVMAWGKLADIIAKYLKKGSRVYLEGRLQQRNWKDKEGKFQNRTDIVADNLVMLGHLGKKKEPDELAKEEVNLQEVEVEE
ncbi:MAG: single-stranded DNA-binding protein [Patescibacteria group bacterium]